MQMKTDDRQVIIKLRNLTRIYKVGVEHIHALDGVDCEVRDNEHVAIMGQSGSGKSTLMNVIGCLDKASSGTYELDGHDTTNMNGKELANIRNERIGFVFQSFELLSKLSALKNVEMPLIYSKDS